MFTRTGAPGKVQQNAACVPALDPTLAVLGVLMINRQCSGTYVLETEIATASCRQESSTRYSSPKLICLCRREINTA